MLLPRIYFYEQAFSVLKDWLTFVGHASEPFCSTTYTPSERREAGQWILTRFIPGHPGRRMGNIFCRTKIDKMTE
jgi:hypothetical protein